MAGAGEICGIIGFGGGTYWLKYSEDLEYHEVWGFGYWWYGEETWFWFQCEKGKGVGGKAHSWGIEPGSDYQSRWYFEPREEPADAL